MQYEYLVFKECKSISFREEYHKNFVEEGLQNDLVLVKVNQNIMVLL